MCVCVCLCLRDCVCIKRSQLCTGYLKWIRNPQKTALQSHSYTSKIFKMIFNTVESFHDKNFFYSGCKKLWIG